VVDGRATPYRVRELLAKMEADVHAVKVAEWEPTGHVGEVNGKPAVYMHKVPAWKRVQILRDNIERIISWYAVEIEQALDE
jgi:hypothetical protein